MLSKLVVNLKYFLNSKDKTREKKRKGGGVEREGNSRVALFLKRRSASWKTCQKLKDTGLEYSGQVQSCRQEDAGCVRYLCHKSISFKSLSDKHFLLKGQSSNFLSFQHIQTTCYFIYLFYSIAELENFRGKCVWPQGYNITLQLHGGKHNSFTLITNINNQYKNKGCWQIVGYGSHSKMTKAVTPELPGE